jgi:hypothetical protein
VSSDQQIIWRFAAFVVFGVIAHFSQIHRAKSWRKFITDRDNERAERLVAKARRDAAYDNNENADLERATHVRLQLLAGVAGALFVAWVLLRVYVLH